MHLDRRSGIATRSGSKSFSFLFVVMLLIGAGCKPTGTGSGSAGDAQSSGQVSSSRAPVELTTSSQRVMVLIPDGNFRMGTDSGEPDETPIHSVSLSAFLIDKIEVTQEQFAKLELPDPSNFKSRDRPVEQVRWSDAVKFCNELSLAEGLEPCYDENDLHFKCNFEASGYRLPTEAEWEYAARAGSETIFDFGSSSRELKKFACYADNSKKKTDPVATRKPNMWGLYDMYGNVSEWCHDVYSDQYYATSQEDDPRGSLEGKKRVLRGGSWKSSSRDCRATRRMSDFPGYADACFARNTYGFRCVRKPSVEELQKYQASERQ